MVEGVPVGGEAATALERQGNSNGRGGSDIVAKGNISESSSSDTGVNNSAAPTLALLGGCE